MSLCDAVRTECARVVARARSVHIDERAAVRWIASLAHEPRAASDADPGRQRLGDTDTTLAYVITLDAINFGSGWFPELRKRPGASGYFTIATCLRERFERDGAWTSVQLRRIDSDACAEVLGQRGNAGVRDLMELFARALRDLGGWLAGRHGGSFARAVEAARGSAEALAESLAEMPLYRDVARHAGVDVPFYKRAQITPSDLAAAFEGRGFGAFRDLDRLTIFADNLVPHVLRCEGVLVYERALAERIDAGQLLAAGSREEIEIRAGAVHVVERAVTALRQLGIRASARELDELLWNRGGRPEFKAHPRHRARCPYY